MRLGPPPDRRARAPSRDGADSLAPRSAGARGSPPRGEWLRRRGVPARPHPDARTVSRRRGSFMGLRPSPGTRGAAPLPCSFRHLSEVLGFASSGSRATRHRSQARERYRDGAPRRERERLPSITAKAFGRGKSRAGRGFLVNPQPPEGAARPDGLLFGFVSARAMQEPPLPAPAVRLRGRRRLPRVVHSPRAAQWRIAPAGRFNVCSKVALRPGGGCRGRFHTSTNKGK